MKYIAYKFEDDNDLIEAVEYIQSGSVSASPVPYDVVAGSSILVVPASFRALLDFIPTKFNGEEVDVEGFSGLEPKERSRRRGHLLKRTA